MKQHNRELMLGPVGARPFLSQSPVKIFTGERAGKASPFDGPRCRIMLGAHFDMTSAQMVSQ